MSNSTRPQHYPYSFRTSAEVDGTQLYQDKAFFYLIPPERALTIENLRMHLKFTFDASVSVGNRIVQAVGIADEFPAFITDEPNRLLQYEINQAADGSRKVDIMIDLTPLLKRDDVAFRDFIEPDGLTGLTYAYLKLADGCRGALAGTIELWKVDATFTTEGIA